MSDEKIITEANTIAQFLNDPAVKGVVERLNKRYYKQFVDSKTPEERESAWAKARVLEDLATEMLAAVDAGKLATARRKPAGR